LVFLIDTTMKKGYFGIGIYQTKEQDNVGTLWRSAMNFGADYIFTIGARYKRQRTDTTKTWKNIPLFEYRDWDDFKAHIPRDAELVFVEQTEDAKLLETATHPKRAIYILGAEDYGVPVELKRGHQKVQIDTPMCLNAASAGSIVMYDRHLKERAARA